MIYHLLVAAAVVASASATANLSTQDPTHLKQLWDSFKEQFGRTYSTMDEENSRFKIFVENLKTIDQRNSEDTAIHGITRFSDLTQAEFEARYLTADPKMKTNDRELDLTARTVDTAAALVDWTGKFTTPVRDQGYCGSCWAFSATEQIESDGIRTGRWDTKKYVSVEQVVQCDTTSYGCDGGWTEHAYNYVKSKGVGSDSAYPYTSYQGTTGKCPATTPTAVLKITGYKTLSGESNMASYVQTTGPLSVCVDASNWSSYKSGILSSCTKRVNHCVQAVGVDTAGGYWKVRNSWGTSWGEAGFIRLAYGANTCAITNDPTYVTF